jgi:hypothetical protein
LENVNVSTVENQGLRTAVIAILLIGLVDILLSSIFAQSAYNFAVFSVLLIITGITVPFIRMLRTRSYKVFACIYIGFAAYWVVGTAYNDPDVMFGQFLPVVIFAFANGIAILISIVDGSDSGYIYSSMGFTVVAYNVLITGDLSYVGGKPDILLLSAVLWSLIPLLWCYLFSKVTARLTFNAKNRFLSTLKNGVLTLPVYLLLGIVILTSQGGRSFNIPSASSIGDFFSANPQISGILIAASWFYLLVHTIAVMVAFFSNELVLHAYKIEKGINDDGEIHYHIEKKTEAPKVATEDPYKNIIKEMKMFKKDFGAGKVNRLVATQKTGKIRNEMDLLTTKYHHGSKEEAENLLREIEKEIEFAFR